MNYGETWDWEVKEWEYENEWKLYKNRDLHVAMMVKRNMDGTVQTCNVKWSNEKNTWVRTDWGP